MAYGRIIQVTIGPPGGTGQTITGLHMSFKVKKALGVGIGGPTAELKIFNMSLQSYFTFVKINYGLSIAVGYQDESVGAQQNFGETDQQSIGVPLTLFSGAIRFSRRYREGPDMIVYIEADGAMWNIGGAPYSVSMQPGVSLYTLLANLGSSLQISIRNLGAVPQNVVYASGFSFIGRIRDFVAQVCSKIGFLFVIEAGEIVLIPPLASGSSATMTGVFLSKATGLLQPPQPEQISVGVPDASSEAPGGSQALPKMRWKIDSLLLPQVGPGDVMLVESDNFANAQAYMMAIDLEYTGDNRKDDWKTEARCIPVDSTGAQTTLQTSSLVQGAPA